MTYAFVTDVPAPVELYDALHAEVMRRAPAGADGLLVHVGRSVDGGFQVLEVWESQEHCDRFVRDVVGPAMAQLSGGQDGPLPPPPTEFAPRGLIVPGAGVLV